MSKTQISSSAIILSMVLYASHVAAHIGDTTKTIDEKIINRFDSILTRYTKSFGTRAIVGGVFNAGQDTILRKGRINLFGRRPSDQDMFQIASVSKTFTSYMLANAIRQNKVKANESIAPHLSIRKRAKFDSTTFIQLATHSSGLQNNSWQVHTPTVLAYLPLTYVTADILYPLTSLPQSINFLPWELAFIPSPIPYFSLYGEKSLNRDLNSCNLKKMAKRKGEFHYSNIGMGLLGKILSEMDSMSYEEKLQEEICKPYGLSNTTTEMSKAQKKRFATAHNMFGSRHFRTKMKKGGIEGAGDINMNATDMMKYLKMQLKVIGDGTLHRTLDIQHKHQYDTQHEAISMAMGWIINQREGMPDIYWHNGQISGSSAFIAFCPETQTGLFLLANNGKAKRLTKMGGSFMRYISS